jgi:hypothetical protein
MLQTVEALLEPDGRIHLLEKLNLSWSAMHGIKSQTGSRKYSSHCI